MENELVKIHNTLNFTDRRQLTREIPEQLMVVKHIKPTDVVLEFGGSIGRNTCILSSILDKSENLVTILSMITFSGNNVGLSSNKDMYGICLFMFIKSNL